MSQCASPLDPAEVATWPAWHPPHAVLELAELVLGGAVGAGASELIAQIPAGRRVEDAEGTPVAARDDAGLHAIRPFAHGPLRGHRLTPAEVRAGLPAGEVVAIPVAGPLTGPAVADLLATLGGATPLWFALVGAGHEGDLPPEGLFRAVRELADASGGIAVPLALPAGFEELLPEIARTHGAGRVLDPAAGRVLDPAATGAAQADHSASEASPPAGAAVHPAFAAELARAHRAPAQRGLVLFFTGLSGSGKSTVAKAVAERILDDGRRTLTLLDGDEVRRMLSAGLGFSQADRDANIRRIGFVAAEVARHGGTAVCAPIAPFASVRTEVRDMVRRAGGDLILVHVATPLAECERRDRKGLYAKARRGEIADFTGISSPYEAPDDADLVLDTTGRPVTACADDVWTVLQSRGYLPMTEPTG